jgi:hypothetical protein
MKKVGVQRSDSARNQKGEIMSTLVAEPTTTLTASCVNHFEITSQLEMTEGKTHQIYTLPPHHSSLLTFTVLIQDVEDRMRTCFNASYAWYRVKDGVPVRELLANPYGTPDLPPYMISTFANCNDIQIKIWNTYPFKAIYTIVGDYIFATSGSLNPKA